jgi:hypothetical protein
MRRRRVDGITRRHVVSSIMLLTKQLCFTTDRVANTSIIPSTNHGAASLLIDFSVLRLPLRYYNTMSHTSIIMSEH